MAPETEVTEATKQASAKEAERSHDSDRAPTADEEAAADESRARFRDDREQVAEHEDEMLERGANVKGEGEVK